MGTLTYGYNDAGERVETGGAWARAAQPAAVASAAYNAANHQLTFGGQTLTYDLNGNLTSDGTNTYTWNARNKLSAISGPTSATFVYDGLGRRRQKTVSGTATDFLYDGLSAVQEQSGATTTNILGGLGIDERFMRTNTTETRHPLTDALGSTVALTDAPGTVQTTYTYEAFGAATAAGASTTNAYSYTGRENDATGLYYYRARYYHPGLSRFISEDPIGLTGGYANLYTYVANNPVRFTDSLGLRIDWGGQVLRNPDVVENLWKLNDAIVAQGIPDAAFTIRVSGGDRYRDCLGNIISASNGKPVTDSAKKSPHLYENGAIGVDVVVAGAGATVVDTAAATTSFDPRQTRPPSSYPKNPHHHFELPPNYALSLNDVPDVFTGRKDLCR